MKYLPTFIDNCDRTYLANIPSLIAANTPNLQKYSAHLGIFTKAQNLNPYKDIPPKKLLTIKECEASISCNKSSSTLFNFGPILEKSKRSSQRGKNHRRKNSQGKQPENF